jgi:hypothetical protein
MPTAMSLPSFGPATSRNYPGVWQANYGLKLTSQLVALAQDQLGS